MKKINKTYFFLFLITLLSFTVSAQLTNGNLEAGGSGNGFLVNQYTLSPLTGVSSPGSYGYTNNPQTMDSSFFPGGDKTTGFGKMLVYNGATTANTFIWTASSTGGTLAGFTIGLTYTFSYWIKSVTNTGTQANINLFFNPGNVSNLNPSSPSSLAPLQSQGWVQVSYSFTANATSLMIRLYDSNLSALGNDFALDDFSIRQGVLPLTLSYTSINPSCPSSLDGSITATAAGGSLPYNYSLSIGTTVISNSTGIFNNLVAGSYTLTVTDAATPTINSSTAAITLSAPNDITISAPTTICEGTSTTLSVSGSTSSYLWTATPADPSLTAANNTTANPVVSPTVNTTYTVKSGVPADPTNLIYNGDFSLGDSGFDTGYAYPTSTLQQGTYGIVTNPNAWFNPFVACSDHTGGPGTRNMFVADGATSTPLTLVYKPYFFPIFSPPGSPNIAIVLPNKSYTFSFFLANVVNSSGSPAVLEVIINGIRVGNLATAPFSPCTWVEHSFVWNSGSSTTATISIFDTNIDIGGNDFAIDDVKFRETPTCLYEKSVTITVSPNPAPIVGTITQPTCSTATGSVLLTGLPSGNWTINPGGISGSTATTTISGLTAGPHAFTVTNADGCISAPLSVVIDPVPNTSTPSFATFTPVCFGSVISLPLLSTNGVSGTWSPSFNATATTTYTFTPNPGQCSNTTTIQVDIIPIPVGTASPTTETICSLQSTGISLSSSISGTTFSWTAASTDVSGANPDNGNIISQILTATGTLVGNVVYTITPTYNGCSGIPIQATVLVTPKPVITATPSNTSICSGSTANIALSSTMPNTIFSWNLVQTNVTGGLSGTGFSISQNLSTISNASGNAVYAITPNVNGCPGATTIVTITVNPIPVVTVNPALGQTICSGATTAISLSSPVINTTYDWSVTQTNLNGTFSGSGTSIAQTLSTLLPSIGTATYVITPTAQGCIGAPASVVVNVNPTPEFFGTPTQLPICSGETTSIVLTPSLSGTTFSWTVVQNGVSGASIGNGNNIFQLLETTGNAVGTVIYSVTPALNSCPGIPIIISTSVNPLPLPEINDGIICADASGIPLRTYTLDSGLNSTDYTFQWFLNGTLQSGTANTFEALAAGNYSVIATNFLTGCISDEVFATVTASIPATSISAVGTVAFDVNASIVVTALEPNPNYEYALDYGALQSSNVFTNVNPGNHIVMVTDSNGCSNLSTTISVIGYPTYFTPNGDGFNDFWNIIGLESQPSSKIYIFDRYGKFIKQISSKSLGWDGTFNGALLPASDYWFTIEYIEPLTTDLKVFKSHFSLKR